MKAIISYSLLLLCLLIYLTFTPKNLPDYEAFEFNEDSNAYVLTTGVTHDLSELTKQAIYDYELATFVTSFDNTFYIPKSVHTYDGIFNRSWAKHFQLDYQTKPNVELSGYLFKDDHNEYYILLTYQSKNNAIFSNYTLTINSNNLDYQVLLNTGLLTYKHKSLVSKYDLLSQSNQNTYSYVPRSIKHNLDNPNLEGILLLKLNDSPTDFLQIIIDFYESNTVSYQSELGMNRFIEPNDRRMIPQSIILTYKEHNL